MSGSLSSGVSVRRDGNSSLHRRQAGPASWFDGGPCVTEPRREQDKEIASPVVSCLLGLLDLSSAMQVDGGQRFWG